MGEKLKGRKRGKKRRRKKLTQDDDIVQQIERCPAVHHGASVSTAAWKVDIPTFFHRHAVEEGAADGHDATNDQPDHQNVDHGSRRVRLEDSMRLAGDGQLVQHLRKIVNGDGRVNGLFKGAKKTSFHNSVSFSGFWSWSRASA